MTYAYLTVNANPTQKIRIDRALDGPPVLATPDEQARHNKAAVGGLFAMQARGLH